MASESLGLLIHTLRVRELTVGFAESCTGGLLSATLAAEAGVSDVFVGSVISYSNSVKVEQLGVSAHALKLEGAVSDRVALSMAQGVRKNLKSDWSVSITGIAGPSGGSSEKPVGTVWFAVVGPQFEEVRKKLFTGSRTEIQKQAVNFAIEFLLEGLKRVY